RRTPWLAAASHAPRSSSGESRASSGRRTTRWASGGTTPTTCRGTPCPAATSMPRSRPRRRSARCARSWPSAGQDRHRHAELGLPALVSFKLGRTSFVSAASDRGSPRGPSLGWPGQAWTPPGGGIVQHVALTVRGRYLHVVEEDGRTAVRADSPTIEP